MEALVLLGGLTRRLEIDGALGDSVDVVRRRQELVTEQVVREGNTVKDVLLRQGCNLAHTADLDAVAGDYGRARADSAPRDHGFRLVAHGSTIPVLAKWLRDLVKPLQCRLGEAQPHRLRSLYQLVGPGGADDGRSHVRLLQQPGHRKLSGRAALLPGELHH